MNLIKNIEQYSFILKKKVNQALQLLHHRSQESEVSIIRTTGITVSTRYGNVENVEFDDNSVLKITVFINKKKGIAFSNSLVNHAIIDTVNAAVNIAHYTSVDRHMGIADKNLLALNPIDLDLCHPIEIDANVGINLASKSEKIALEYDRRIISTEGARFSGHIITRVFGNSHGMLNSFSSSQYSLSCNVIAESNGSMEQNYAYSLHRVFKKLSSPEWVGQECARKVLSRLGSRKIKTTESPVLFMSEVAVSLFQHLFKAIDGNNVYRKSTFLLNYLGKKIFPYWLSIKELPHIHQELGSSPFDYEGVKTVNKLIVNQGVLNSWLLDTYSARHIGLKSTGNAGGIYNWYISCQNISFEELVKSMNLGLIVTDLIGQGVNIVTGDYSRGVSGFWVKNGEIQYPVHEITISGNLKNMFVDIMAISNDIETRSNIRCGSVLIKSMKIAGI